MTAIESLKQQIKTEPWFASGAAGFIGSNLLETLRKLNQHVVDLYNFSTGHQPNLNEVQTLGSPEKWATIRFENTCGRAKS